MPKRIAKQIYNRILEAEHILLVPHQNPDGDTLGSVTAMMHWLTSIGKKHVAFCATSMSPKLKFLPHVDLLSNDERIWKNNTFDLIIAFDSSDLSYAGIETHVEALDSAPDIINIDHHNTNTRFGKLNLVIDNASSTTMILYQFFVYNNVTIEPNMATSLLTGLVTDTGNFTNAATTGLSMDIASRLLERGGDLGMIQGWTMKDRSINGLKLWGKILGRLEQHDNLGIVHTYVTRKDIKDHDVDESEVDGFANFLNVLEEGRAGMILKENADGSVKGSFRTTRDDVDVSAFAKLFNGGGHKKAAGFSLEGPIEKAAEFVFEKILEFEGLERIPVRA